MVKAYCINAGCRFIKCKYHQKHITEDPNYKQKIIDISDYRKDKRCLLNNR